MSRPTFRTVWAELKAELRRLDAIAAEERRAARDIVDSIVERLDAAPITGEDEDAWNEWRVWADAE